MRCQHAVAFLVGAAVRTRRGSNAPGRRWCAPTPLARQLPPRRSAIEQDRRGAADRVAYLRPGRAPGPTATVIGWFLNEIHRSRLL